LRGRPAAPAAASLLGWARQALRYGFTDIDGSRPDAWRFIKDTERGVAADPVDYRSL